jgi:hypothetical protein
MVRPTLPPLAVRLSPECRDVSHEGIASGCDMSLIVDRPGRPLRFSINTPTSALGFRDPGATSFRFRPRRQSTMKAATRFPKLDPH